MNLVNLNEKLFKVSLFASQKNASLLSVIIGMKVQVNSNNALCPVQTVLTMRDIQ